MTVALALLWIAGVVGCSSDYRISLADFLERQRAFANIQREKAERATPLDLDRYLGPYRVGPGDVLTLSMVGADGVPLFPPVPLRVDHNQAVDLPLVGKVKVGGQEMADVEDTILKAYVPKVYKDAVCHVETLTQDTTDVLVIGAVATPGLVQLRRTERNMLFAVVGAGGASEQASGEVTLRRIRRPSESVTLNLRDPVELNAAVMLDPLERGDIVQVHTAQPNTIFVGGLVNQPGRQDYPPGVKITFLQALAAAQGVMKDVTPKSGTLIRRMPDGRDAHVRLDLDRLMKGQHPNFQLAAGDILWIPETLQTRIQEFINRNIFLRGGATVTYNLSGFDTFSGGGGFGGAGTLQDSFDPLGFFGQ